MIYHKDEEQNITDLSEKNIESMYDKGFKFTRLSKGNMQSTKNLRVNLSNFYIFTKNKRIISKYPNLEVRFENLPLSSYDYTLGKLAKDFYDTKFGKGVFSVVKIKEILTSNTSNFNSLAVFSLDSKDVGYCILYKSSNIIHYCYPFYDLSFEASYLGLAMMTKVITEAKEMGLKYVYLGGANASKDMYKLQFKGLEWWDKDKWNINLEELKEIIKNIEGVK